MYDAQGVTGTISRLASWLEDTEAGHSQYDGWEPTPRGMGISSVSLNIGAMQRYVSKRTKASGIAYGKCGLLYDNQTQNLNDFIYFLSEGTIKNLSPDKNRFSLAKDYYRPYKEMHCITDIPVVCIWASDDDIVPHHQPTLIDSPNTLRSYAKETGIDERLAFFENSILANAKVVTNTKPYILLILAQRRPKPLIPDIPSDAVGYDRSIELIPLAIRISLEQSLTLEAVHQCDTVAETTNSLLAQMAGITKDVDNVTVVGCGAVGSTIASQIGRLGATHITLVDNDIFLPHNVSRHLLGKDAIGYRKSYILKKILEMQLPLSIAAKKKKLQELNDTELKKINKNGLLIDCTAELSLTQFSYGNSDLPKVLKAELAYEGRLGILALEGETHNPCIQDIKACLYKSALTNSHIEQWLASKEQLSSVSTGQNCASSTMIMPNYVVSSHVSSFMPKIQQVITKHNEVPGLGINILNEDGFPIGWEWLDIPAFQVFVSDSSNGKWDVRIHPEVIAELNKLSSQYAPTEAGGFLYGTYDRVTRSICIVHHIAPKTAKHEPTSITLPVAGETDEEKGWLQKTAGLLPLLGTWHSHVNQPSTPSHKDKQRMADAAVANVATPTPFIILITGSDGIGINVVLPENW
ncbi:MAG: ThiF family adenylyltransferase [Candidatus Thiodiazotropha endolucinida]